MWPNKQRTQNGKQGDPLPSSFERPHGAKSSSLWKITHGKMFKRQRLIPRSFSPSAGSNWQSELATMKNDFLHQFPDSNPSIPLVLQLPTMNQNKERGLLRGLESWGLIRIKLPLHCCVTLKANVFDPQQEILTVLCGADSGRDLHTRCFRQRSVDIIANCFGLHIFTWKCPSNLPII